MGSPVASENRPGDGERRRVDVLPPLRISFPDLSKPGGW
jgi:hypothetical protein